MYKFDKDQLLKESQELGFDEVDMDSILESLDIDADTKEQLVEAFTLASRKGAVQLTEAHLTQIVARAEEMLEESVIGVVADYNEKLDEAVDTYLVAVGDEWLEENKQAIENRTESKLFKSLLSDLKESFINHNVSIPDEKIDLFEELTLEEQETRAMANDLFKKNKELTEALNTIKRDSLVESLSVSMTESQKETFADLAKAMKLDESFESRVQKLSESFAVAKTEPKMDSLTESLVKGAKVQTKAEKDETVLAEEQGAPEAPKVEKKELTERELLRNSVL